MVVCTGMIRFGGLVFAAGLVSLSDDVRIELGRGSRLGRSGRHSVRLGSRLSGNCSEASPASNCASLVN